MHARTADADITETEYGCMPIGLGALHDGMTVVTQSESEIQRLLAIYT